MESKLIFDGPELHPDYRPRGFVLGHLTIFQDQDQILDSIVMLHTAKLICSAMLSRILIPNPDPENCLTRSHSWVSGNSEGGGPWEGLSRLGGGGKGGPSPPGEGPGIA
jgi:hypothetical protein